MIDIEVTKDSETPYFFMKLLVIGVFAAMSITIGGYYGLMVYLLILFVGHLFIKHKKMESNKRRQRAFMRSFKKKRSIDMRCGRWGDFYFVRIFGIDLAADSDNPRDIKEMLFDAMRIIRSLEKDGKLPKGRLYSERVAYFVTELGLDAEMCRWLCETEVLSDIDFLVRMGYSREPRSMSEWVDVIQGRARADGRIIYNSSYISRVINDVERLAEKVQIENIRAGGFRTIG